MRFASSLVVVLVVGCGPEELPLPGAPELTDPTSDGLVERSHEVRARLERGVVLLSVRRRIDNHSGRFEELAHPVTLPAGAVVRSLSVGGAPATLLGAVEAADRWQQLIAPGAGAPAPLGLLEWGGSENLTLRLFGLGPGATDVEYELMVPPAWVDGEWQVDYPAADPGADLELATPEVTVDPAAGERVEEVREEPTDDGPGALTALRLHLRRAPIEHVEARWATFPLAPGRTLWRLELDAAAVLEPAPVRPNVVFVVDASHSEGPDGVAAQLELVAPYLASARDAQVEVVLFRRGAERLFGRFVPAADVDQLLAAVPAHRLAPGNGSNLELGAALAAEALSQAGGVGRVVLLSDGLMRDAFTAELATSALAKAPAGTVAHVVLREATPWSELTLRRDDEHALAPVAAATGGMLVSVDGHGEDPAQAAATLEGLVRPVRIDHFTLEAPGLPEDLLDENGDLAEGVSVRRTAIDEAPPRQLTLRGKIWGRDFHRAVWPSGELAEQLPGLAIGDGVESDLTREEVLTAARAAGVVSRETSLLAAPLDATASTAGRDDAGPGFLSMSGFGCSSHCGGWSHDIGRITQVEAIDHVGLLRALLEDGVAACARGSGVAPSGATVTVEVTGDEIVAAETAAPSPAFAACVTEAAWAVRLPPAFVGHHTFSVPLASR